jgi:Domain of unknown function (DUF4394)
VGRTSIADRSTGDTELIGIDYRVQDGKLYGVGDAGGIYVIDPSTAVATLDQRDAASRLREQPSPHAPSHEPGVAD